MAWFKKRVPGEVYPVTNDSTGNDRRAGNTSAGSGKERSVLTRNVTPLIVIVDTSDSMNFPEDDPPIKKVNQGLAYLCRHLMEDLLTRHAVWICVIAVGGGCARVVNDFEAIREWVPPVLKADGMTPMGDGIRLALNQFRELRKRLGSYGITMTQGIMVVMTDGCPTDETDEIIRELHKEARAGTRGHLSIWGFGTPPNADMSFLRSLVTDPDKAVMLEGTREYRQLFAWIGNSVSAISHSHGPEAQTDKHIKKYS